MEEGGDAVQSTKGQSQTACQSSGTPLTTFYPGQPLHCPSCSLAGVLTQHCPQAAFPSLSYASELELTPGPHGEKVVRAQVGAGRLKKSTSPRAFHRTRHCLCPSCSASATRKPGYVSEVHGQWGASANLPQSKGEAGQQCARRRG